MNGVMQVRSANEIQESVYYYRLNRLRKMALVICKTPNSIKNNNPISRTFAQIPVTSAVPAPKSKPYEYFCYLLEELLKHGELKALSYV